MTSAKTELSDVELLKMAIEAARTGDKPEARRLLHEAAQSNPKNEKVWLWRASLAITPQVAVTYLQYVLRINPANATAKAWLEKLAAAKQENATPSSSPATSATANVAAGAAPAVAGPPQANAPAAAPPAPAVRFAFECPVCLHGTDQEPERCEGCGARLSLNVEIVAANSGASEKHLNAALARIKGKSGWEESYEAQVNLAMVNLNLMNTGTALEHLMRARQLNPREESIWNHVLRLATRPLVLVVDDSLTIRTLVARTLESNGFRTKCCASGSDALSSLRAEIPKLILLDVSMPHMDGYQLCKLIKSLKEAKNVPVVMLSGNDGFFDKVKGRVAGATDYLTKPFEPEVALRAIRKYIGL